MTRTSALRLWSSTQQRRPRFPRLAGRTSGPFQVAVPPAVQVNWLNRLQIETIDRTQPLTVTWSPQGSRTRPWRSPDRITICSRTRRARSSARLPRPPDRSRFRVTSWERFSPAAMASEGPMEFWPWPPYRAGAHNVHGFGVGHRCRRADFFQRQDRAFPVRRMPPCSRTNHGFFHPGRFPRYWAVFGFSGMWSNACTDPVSRLIQALSLWCGCIPECPSGTWTPTTGSGQRRLGPN